MECAIREAFEETGMHLRNEPEAGGCPCAFCSDPCRHVLTDESPHWPWYGGPQASDLNVVRMASPAKPVVL